MKTQTFTIGGIDFAAVREQVPIAHWRLRIEETGEVLQPGTGGVSTESIPKMQADLKYQLERISKGVSMDFRRSWGLPAWVASQALPKTLLKLSEAQIDLVEASLCNDEASSDEEMIEYWTQTCGIPLDAANEAIKFRTQALLNFLFSLKKKS